MKKFSSLFLIFFIFFTIDVAYSIDWTNLEECESHMYRIRTELNNSIRMEANRSVMSDKLCKTAKDEYKQSLVREVDDWYGNAKEIASMLKSVVRREPKPVVTVEEEEASQGVR